MLDQRQNYWLLLLIALSIFGCFSGGSYVPVRAAGERSTGAAKHHVVRKGDTLYSVAFRYGLDYKLIAEANNIDPPYTIYLNQKLALAKTKPRRAVQATKLRQKTVTRKSAGVTKNGRLSKSQSAKINWRWPVDGVVVNGFALSGKVNKGVDIRGRLGESVGSAADGVVVYAGSGLRGYGKLVIVKHSDRFLSAYGHNQAILVKEGDKVKSGQVVAEIGSSGPNHEMLHFEIRKNGKPEDPLKYLPNR